MVSFTDKELNDRCLVPSSIRVSPIPHKLLKAAGDRGFPDKPRTLRGSGSIQSMFLGA